MGNGRGYHRLWLLDTYAYAHAYSHAHAYTDGHAYADRYAYWDAYADGDAYSNPESVSRLFGWSYYWMGSDESRIDQDCHSVSGALDHEIRGAYTYTVAPGYGTDAEPIIYYELDQFGFRARTPDLEDSWQQVGSLLHDIDAYYNPVDTRFYWWNTFERTRGWVFRASSSLGSDERRDGSGCSRLGATQRVYSGESLRLDNEGSIEYDIVFTRYTKICNVPKPDSPPDLNLDGENDSEAPACDRSFVETRGKL